MNHFTIALVLIVSSVILGCSRSGSSIDPAAEKKEIEAWQKERLARLTRPDGWLTLCGLFWLKDGQNRCGSDSSNDVIFPPGKTPPSVGSLIKQDDTVRFEAAPNVHVTMRDSLISTALVYAGVDTVEPRVLTVGSINFFIIKRGNQLGVRVKDTLNPARVNFAGLDYYPIDPKWHVTATFEPYNPPKLLPIATKINTIDTMQSPGALHFEIDGKPLQLDAVIEDPSEKQFFIMFTDETSGSETYGAGRQLYADLPDKDNHVVLDFNRAYNWPCVFTEFATCPIPPRQNHLPIRVEAGEKMYKGHEGG